MKHRRILDDDERWTYLRDVLGNRYIQTTDSDKPYLSGEYVNITEDTNLLRWVTERHGEKPAVITSKAAIQTLIADDGPAAEFVDETMHYGAIKSSNQFEDRTVGAVLGCPQLSDREIQRQAALDGHATEPDRTGSGGVTFSGVGDDYLHHTREGDVGQAALRFGRDKTTTATVYVHTAAVPDWLPTERWRIPTESEQQVMLALTDLGTATTPEIAEHADLTPQRIRQVLNQLADEDVVNKRPGKTRTDATTWRMVGVDS